MSKMMQGRNRYRGNRYRGSRYWVIVLLCGLLGPAWTGLSAGVAHAATFTVSKTADTGDSACNADCSLREAINAANNQAGDDSIVFDATAFNERQTITLNGSQLPAITTNVTITGTPVGVILNANGQSRVLQIGPDTTVTLSKLTITGGDVSNGGFFLVNSAGGHLQRGRADAGFLHRKW